MSRPKGHPWAIWSVVDPCRLLYDSWHQHCTKLWWGVPSTKFGDHRVFLSNLTPCWPWLTPAWLLTTAIHYSGLLPTKFGINRAFLKQLHLWMTFDLWSGHFEKILSNLVGPSLIPMPSFCSIPRNALHTYTHAERLGY